MEIRSETARAYSENPVQHVEEAAEDLQRKMTRTERMSIELVAADITPFKNDHEKMVFAIRLLIGLMHEIKEIVHSDDVSQSELDEGVNEVLKMLGDFIDPAAESAWVAGVKAETYQFRERRNIVERREELAKEFRAAWIAQNGDVDKAEREWVDAQFGDM